MRRWDAAPQTSAFGRDGQYSGMLGQTGHIWHTEPAQESTCLAFGPELPIQLDATTIRGNILVTDNWCASAAAASARARCGSLQRHRKADGRHAPD